MRQLLTRMDRHGKRARRLISTAALVLAGLASPALVHATPVQLEGTLEVMHWDNSDKTSVTKRYLRTADGKRYELKFKTHAPTHLTGTKIRVKGEQSGNVLALSTGSTSYQVLAAPAANTFGAQNTAVLLVNFQDNQTQPYTVDQATSVVFGESSDFFKENSAQQTWLTGQIFGWYTMPITQTCNSLDIENYALQAATAAGVDMSVYSRRVIVFPKNTSCAWAGVGTVGGNPSTAWLNGSLARWAVTHEMGHNFGLYHSHSLECGTSTLGSNCTANEYGDFVETMGGSNFVHFNPFQKERLGWLNYGNSPPIATIESGTGSFTLDPYAATTTGTKAVKVLKSIDPTTGQKSWYYIEYRQPIGFDAPLANFSYVINGVMVRVGSDGDGDSSYLLDMTPNSNSNEGMDWVDAPLAVGQSYADSSNGVTISLVSISSTGATVSVSVNGQASTSTPTCTHTNPGIAMSSSSASVAPGTAVTYMVSVTNTDSTTCSSSQFNLSAAVPTGWTVSPASAALTLAPGSSGSTSVAVTSPTTATTGYYNVSSTAVNSSASSYSASTSTTYSVAATTSTTQSPIAVNDSATTKIATPAVISVLANDSDPAGKPLTVTAVGVPAHGKAVINSNGTVTYTPSGKYKGSDSFGYTISDGSNTASAVVTVQITR